VTSPPPRTGPDFEEQALHILRTAALIESRLDVALRPLDLTADRWRALVCISQQPGAAMADLIDALAMPSSSATRTVDALVEIGALFRTPHESDRRRVTLNLSAQGKQLLAEAAGAVAALGLSPEFSAAIR
jgi:DNA-binding MarR family transcriptional regulator